MPRLPNATCPVCGASVFFWRNRAGSKVWFDALGAPWPKHPCLDLPAFATRQRRIDVARARLRAEGPLPPAREVRYDAGSRMEGGGCFLIVGVTILVVWMLIWWLSALADKSNVLGLVGPAAATMALVFLATATRRLTKRHALRREAEHAFALTRRFGDLDRR